MTTYIARRLLQMIPLLFGITLVTFVIINAAGSPLNDLEFSPRVRPEDIERLRKNLGLDEPLYKRYFVWVSHLARGDLGYSMINFKPVHTRILEVLPNTLLLSGLSAVLAFFLSLPIGIYAAVRRNSLFDRLATVLAVAGFAVPTVWLGLMLILLFAVQFREWGLPSLPVGGVRDLRGGGGLLDRLEHLILPVTALTVPQLAGWIVYVRAQMLEVIRQDYIRTATAKGLKDRAVLYGHAFRNAVLPLITLIGLSIPDLFAGSVIVENVFAYPGMGRLVITAVGDKDHTLVMGTTLFFAVLVILGNLLADILYAVADPRIRLD
ncbi:MAG: peptide ABC transporter permease [Thermomicrobiales bacterium]|nr:MAG: peptide ABC transporter permease [Thermomicrobiales bacterium]